MATKTYKLPKVTQYVKNAGKSVAYATIDSVKGNVPSINEFISTNSDILKHTLSAAKNYRETVRKLDRDIKKSNVYRAVNTGVKNFIEDAKTGNWYNDRDTFTKEMMSDWDTDLEFNSSDNDNSESSSSTNDMISDRIDSSIGASAVSQATAIAMSTDLTIKSNAANTKLMMAHMDKITSNITASNGAVFGEVYKVNNFLNGPLMTHLDNSRKYYEETTKIMRDNSMMLKEMLEMQRNLYAAQTSNQKNSNLESVLTGSGILDMHGYKKNIKSNVANFLDSTGMSLLNMDMGGTSPLMAFAAAPFKMLLQPLVDRMLSKDFKSALRSFDKGVGTLFTQMIARMNRARDSEYGLLGFLGQIFGVQLDKKDNINTANYKKGAVPFDGVTRQTIIEVIPGYLSRIEAALTGGEERHYDPNSGTWKSARQIQREYEKEKIKTVENANYEARDEIKSLVDSIKKQNEDYAKIIEKTANKMLDRIFDDGGDFDVKNWRKYANNKDDFELILKSLNKNTVRNFASNNMRAREDLSKRIRWNEENGGTYRQLYNGAYDMTGSGNGSKSVPKGFKAGAGILANSFDESGHNIFWYLKSILDKIQNRGGSDSSTSSGNDNDPDDRSPRGGSSSSNNGRESETESSSDGEDDGIDRDAIREEIKREREEEYKNSSKNKKLGNWLKNKIGDSKVGDAIARVVGGAEGILSKPMEFMTKMLNKADENLFKMMFGKNDYVNSKGEHVDSVFEYMIDKVESTFNRLLDSIKKKLNSVWDMAKEKLKPVWDKYGAPVVDELKTMGSNIKNRVSRGLNNTIGKGFRNISSRLFNREVIDHNDVNESAAGRVVTKLGLTMISPGEMIIPASFDKKEQSRMLANEKREKNRIMNSIAHNAAGTVDTDSLKDELTKLYNSNKGKGAKNAASGVLGAGAGLLAGFNPLLGAMAGAGLSILSNSKDFKKIIFGEQLEDGSHKEGIVPKKVQDTFKKYAPDMGDFGIAGGVLGLLTPFGPLGGAMIGAGIGFLKNSESFKKFMFGADLDDGTHKDGLISKKTQEKMKKIMEKALPNTAVGAIGGVMLGPFGFLGNAVLGAGMGLLSSTDAFHKLIFGHAKGEEVEKGKPRKGLVGAIERGIIDPAKEKITAILEDFKEFSKKHVFEPLKRFWDPFKQMLKNLVSDVTNGIKDKLNDIFEKTIGIPIADFLQQKIFKPMTKIFFGILKAPYTLMKGAIAAPMHLLGFTGDNIRAKQIRKGTANDMTAEERLNWMQEHGARNAMSKARNIRAARKYGISFEERDRAIMNMSAEDQESMLSMLKGNLSSTESLQRERGKARKMVGEEISSFFNTKDENGKLRYDKVGYGKVKRKLAKWAADGDFDKVQKWINKSDLSDKEKKDLMNSIKPYMQNAKRASDAMDSARNGNEDLDNKLEQLFGRKMNRRGKRNVMEALKSEIEARGDLEEDKPVEDNTDATKDLNDTIKERAKEFDDRTKDILETLKELNKNLAESLKRQKERNINVKRTGSSGESGLMDIFKPHDEQPLLLPAASTVDADDVKNAAHSAKGGFFKKKALSMVSKGETILSPFMSKMFKKVDEDSKEAVDARKAEEKDQAVKKEEVNETKNTNSILTKMHDKFFGKKENQKGLGGALGKLGSGFGKLLKFLGVGGKIALGLGGVSLFGFATEWFRKHVWPTIKGALFGQTDQDGDSKGGLISGISKSIGKLFNGDGTNPGILTRVKDWYVGEGGLKGIITNKILPNMVTGWGYAMNNVVTPVVSVLATHLPEMLGALGNAILTGLKDAVFGEGRIKTKSRNGNDYSKEFSSMQQGINSNLKSSDSSFFGIIEPSFSGSTSNNSTIENDPYGSGSDSHGGTGGSYDSDSSSGDYSNAKVFEDSKTGLLGSKENHGGVTIGENGEILESRYNYGRNTFDTPLSWSAKTATKSAVRSAMGVPTVAKGLNKFTKKLHKGLGLVGKTVSAGAKGVGAVAGTGAKVGEFGRKTIKNATKEAAGDAAAGAAKGASSKLLKPLKWLFGKIAGTKIGAQIMEAAAKNGKSLTQNALKQLFEKLADKIMSKFGKTLLGKGAAKLLGVLSAGVMSGGASILATFALYFTKGYRDAANILGVPKDSYEISIPQKILCGLVHGLNETFLLGLIPTDTFFDIMIDIFGDVLPFNMDKLKEARSDDSIQAALDKYNQEHPDDPITSLEDYNNRDKLSYKMKKGIKKGLGKAWNATKSGVGKAWNKTKDVVGNAWKTSVDAVKTIVTDPKKILGGIKDTIKDTWGTIMASAKGEFTIFNKKYWTFEGGKGDDNALLGSIAKIQSTTTKVLMSPFALIGNVISKVIKGVMSFVKNAKDGAEDADKDIKNAMKGEYSVFNKEYWSVNERSDDNPLSTVGKVSGIVKRVVMMLPATVGYIGSKVFNKIKDIVEDVKDSKKFTDQKIKDVEDGKYSIFNKKYWEMPNAGEKDNPIGAIGKISSILERVLNIPMLIIKGLWGKLKDKIGDIFGWIKGDEKKFTSESNNNDYNGNGVTGEPYKAIVEDGHEVPTKLDIIKQNNKNNKTNQNNNANSPWKVNDAGDLKPKGKLPLFGGSKVSQLDPSVANMRYNGHTIAEAGCAPVAATNLINNLNGGGMNVATAANYATTHGYKQRNDGTDPRFMSSILNASGIQNREISGRSQLSSSLKHGHPVVIMGRGDSPNSPYGNQNPHYITAMGYDKRGNIVVDDPYERGYQTYKESDITKGAIKSLSTDRRGFGKRFGFGRNVFIRGFGKRFGFGKFGSDTPAGSYVEIPSGLGTYETYMGYHLITADSPELSLKNDAKANGRYSAKALYDMENCATIDGRLGIATVANIGGKLPTAIGDYLDVYFDDGDVWKCIRVDTKSQTVTSYDSNPANEWGHDNGKCVVEVVYDNYSGKCINHQKKVTKIVKVGDYDSKNAISSDGSTTSSDSSNGTANTLTGALTNLGVSMVKALYGEEAYNALFGNNNGNGESVSSVAANGSVESFVQMAVNEDGYHEKSTNSQLDDKTANSGSNNYTKYGQHYGSTGPGWPWCAQFVSWCADKAGIPADAMTRSASVAEIRGGFEGAGRYHRSNSGYTPKRGDVIVFEDGSKHIGIVTGVDGSNVKTIEGNSSDQVAQRSYALSNTSRIHGYGDLGLGSGTGDSGMSGNGGSTKVYGKGKIKSKNLDPFSSSKSSAVSKSLSDMIYNNSYELPKIKGKNLDPGSTTVSHQDNSKSLSDVIYMNSYDAPKKSSPKTNVNTSKADTGRATRAMRESQAVKIFTDAVKSLGGNSSTTSSSSTTTNSDNTQNNQNSYDAGYAAFLQMIVNILMNINNNTAMLSKVIEILSDNFDIKIDKSDIEAAHSETKAQTAKSLRNLIERSNGNITGVSKLLNNKDTEYLINAMRAIASE